MKELPGIYLNNVLKTLNECNDIKYAAYRAAAKVRKLQGAFYLDKLPVEVLGGVLLQHHLTSTENSVLLTSSELSNLLEDLYFVVSREYASDIDIEYTADVLCRFLLQVLNREGGVELLSVKIVLSTLCGSKPRDKYNYLFSQLSDHNNILTSRRLELLLQRLVLVTTFVGEGRTFGRGLIPGTVLSCFENLPSGSLGISLDMFSTWLTRDPQLLVWISTLHRLHLADSVTHEVKCSVCKIAPISGLRYRCLRCLNYNQCQTCFFFGHISRNHKLNHPVQECCYQSTAKQSLWALIATLHNKLKRSGWKLQYLPAENRDSYMEEATLKLDQLEDSSRTTSTLSLHELESIILELEEQSKRLSQGLSGLKQSAMKDMLNDHHSLVEKQIERLRLLKRKLAKKRLRRGLVNSTPCSRIARPARLDPVSPILSSNLTLTWDKYDIGVPADGSCILTWDEGSSSSESCAQPVSSHAYTWLQTTNTNAEGESGAIAKSDEAKEIPEDVKNLQADLDLILDKLQELLTSHSDDPDLETPEPAEDNIDQLLERL